jgi:hypothetical protein
MPSILTLTIIIAVCWICHSLTSGRNAVSPKIIPDGDEYAPDGDVAVVQAEQEITIHATIRFGGDSQKAARMLVDGKPTIGNHYVYCHKGPKGEIFYVGKGVGNRAYSKDRMPHWHHYVKTRCGGQYTVEIVRRFQSDETALEFENDLMALYGDQLVNWMNPGRQTDFAVNARFHELRKANWSFISETFHWKRATQSEPRRGIKRPSAG